MLTTGGNVPDISKAVELLDAVPPVAGRPGRPRRRFAVLLADKGYDSRSFRDACRRRRTEPIIPRRGGKNIKGLGKLRYVVEQTFGLTLEPLPAEDGAGLWPQPVHAQLVAR